MGKTLLLLLCVNLFTPIAHADWTTDTFNKIKNYVSPGSASSGACYCTAGGTVFAVCDKAGNLVDDTLNQTACNTAAMKGTRLWVDSSKGVPSVGQTTLAFKSLNLPKANDVTKPGISNVKGSCSGGSADALSNLDCQYVGGTWTGVPVAPGNENDSSATVLSANNSNKNSLAGTTGGTAGVTNTNNGSSNEPPIPPGSNAGATNTSATNNASATTQPSNQSLADDDQKEVTADQAQVKQACANPNSTDCTNARSALALNQQLLKTHSAAATTDQAQATQQSRVSDIQEKGNAVGDERGKYGGADMSLTKAAIAMAPIVDKTMGTVAGQVANTQNTNTFSQLSANGANINQAQIAQAQATMYKNAAKGETTVAIANGVALASTAYLAQKNLMSTSAISKTQNDAQNQLKNYKTQGSDAYNTALDAAARNCAMGHFNGHMTTDACRADPQVQAQAKNTVSGYINGNANTEITAQKSTAQLAAASMAMTAAAIKGHIDQRVADNQAAAQLNAYAAASNGSFAFNPTTPATDTDTTVNNNPTTGQVVDSTAPDAPLDNLTPAVNPNLDNGGVNAPAPGAFVSSTPSAPAGATGAYAGTAGGTSAAKTDTPADAAAVKAQGGGTYAAGDAAPAHFGKLGGDGNTAPPGMGDAFTAMLRGILDDPKKNDQAANQVFDDGRSPASERNAVLRQDQDIFKAISVKYNSKLQQGAISFDSRT